MCDTVSVRDAKPGAPTTEVLISGSAAEIDRVDRELQLLVEVRHSTVAHDSSLELVQCRHFSICHYLRLRQCHEGSRAAIIVC